jgi:hypothetical protein
MVLTFTLVLVAACEGEFVEGDEGDRESTMVNATPATHRHVIYYCSDSGCCSGTLVGPRAILSSRHCGAAAGDSISVYRYNRTSKGEWGGSFTVKRALRQKKGIDGLLLIELDRNHNFGYASVCQERFDAGDPVNHYGAGCSQGNSKFEDLSGCDDVLWRKAKRIGTSGTHDYALSWNGLPGDSGGPFMYQGSVAAVLSWVVWKWRPITGTSEADIATSVHDGWVFKQGVTVKKRRCRPDRPLEWWSSSANGDNKSGFIRATAKDNKITFYRRDGDDRTVEAGGLTLGGGLTASGSMMWPGTICKITSSGNSLDFYIIDNFDRCSRKSGNTITLHGDVVVSGSASRTLSKLRTTLRTLTFSTDYHSNGGPGGTLVLLRKSLPEPGSNAGVWRQSGNYTRTCYGNAGEPLYVAIKDRPCSPKGSTTQACYLSGLSSTGLLYPFTCQ